MLVRRNTIGQIHEGHGVRPIRERGTLRRAPTVTAVSCIHGLGRPCHREDSTSVPVSVERNAGACNVSSFFGAGYHGFIIIRKFELVCSAVVRRKTKKSKVSSSHPWFTHFSSMKPYQ